MLSHEVNLFEPSQFADVPHVDEVLTRLPASRRHKRVWKATGAEIARHNLAETKGGDPKERRRPRRKTKNRWEKQIGGSS
jgi:hypothetical protein